MVIIDVDDIPIITAFNHLYCLLSTQMKKHFFVSLNQEAAAVSFKALVLTQTVKL